MTYYLLKDDLLAGTQPLIEGMCLADWQGIPGFDLGDQEKSADLILPPNLLAKQIRIDQPGWSPNTGGFGQQIPSPCREVVLHWWGNPIGQKFDGIVSWLRNPASRVSAHAVVGPGRVSQIVGWTTPSWANGNSWANANSITLECDPNDVPGTMATVVELLADLVRQGTLAPDFRLTGHRDHQSTECPGAYYSWLPTIRKRVTDALANQTNQEDEMMTPDQNAKLLDIWWRVTQPEGLATIANAVLDTEVPRGGMEGTELDGPTTLRAELSWLTSAQARMINALTALEKRLAAIEGADK